MVSNLNKFSSFFIRSDMWYLKVVHGTTLGSRSKKSKVNCTKNSDDLNGWNSKKEQFFDQR